MFSVKPTPKPAISATLEFKSKRGMLEVTAADGSVCIHERLTNPSFAFPTMPIYLTPEQADELVAAIQSTRAAQAR